MSALETKFITLMVPITFPKQFSVQNNDVTVLDPGFVLYWRRETINPEEI